MLTALVITLLAAGECDANVDCAGTLVCVEHVCRPAPELPPLPPLESLTPPPMPPAFEAPLEDPCAEPLDVDGRLKAECRVSSRSNPSPAKKANKRKRNSMLQPLGTIALLGGAMFTGGNIGATVGLTASGGFVFPSGVGVVGVVDAKLLVSSGGAVSLFTFGAGVRFGRKSHVTLGAGTGLSAVRFGTARLNGVMFSMLGELALVVGEYFTLMLHPTIDIGGSVTIGTILGGIGVSF